MNLKISLNRNQLKYLVIVAMLIDHIAWAFVPMDSVMGQFMHFVGRLTGPTMAYFVAEGYHYTRNVKKYALRLGGFALLSWAPFVYFEFGTMPVVLAEGHPVMGAGAFQFYMESKNVTLAVYPMFGVLYTLMLGLLAIWLWDRGRCPVWCKKLGIVGLCLLSLFGDWPVYDVLFCLFLYRYREEPKEKWKIFCIITAFCCIDMLFAAPIWSGLYMLGIFMVPLLIHFCYNGESGSRKPVHKWFFYIFYPAHLLILGILRWIVFM